MSNPKIEVTTDKSQSTTQASQKVNKNLEKVRETIKKTNTDLGALTRSMETFGRVSGQTLTGVGKAFSNMFKNANAQADALIQKMRQMQQMFNQKAPTIFGPNGQVVAGPTPVTPGAAQPGGGWNPGPQYPNPGIVGPNGQPVPPGGGQPPGGGGQPPGNQPGQPNQNQQWTDRQKTAMAVAIASGAMSVGATAYSAWNRQALEGTLNNASKASFFGDMRNRLVSGDVTDLMMIGKDSNFLNEGADIGERGARMWNVQNGLQLAGAGIKTAVGLGAGGPLGGAIAVDGITDAINTGINWWSGDKTDKPGAASAEAMKAWLEAKKASDPTFVRTMQDLQQNGARRSRSYRLFGSGGESEVDAQNRYKDLAKAGAEYGMGEGDVASMQEALSSMVGSTRGNNLVGAALAAETRLGMGREASGAALASIDKGGLSNASNRLDELVAKGFVKGIKDSKFKEDIASVVVENSTLGGRSGAGAMELASILQSILPKGFDAYDMDAAKGGIKSLNSYWNGASGGVESTNFAKLSQIGREYGLDIAGVVGINNASLPELGQLRAGENNSLAGVLGGKDRAAEIAQKTISAKTRTLFGVAGASLGENLIDKYGGKEKLYQLLQNPNSQASIDLIKHGTLSAETGAINGSKNRDESTYMLKQILAMDLNKGALPLTAEEKEFQAAQNQKRGDQTNVAANQAAGAKAFLDVLEKAADPKLTAGLQEAARIAQAAAAVFANKSTAQDPSQLIRDVTKAIEFMYNTLSGLPNLGALVNSPLSPGWQAPVAPSKQTGASGTGAKGTVISGGQVVPVTSTR